MSRADDNFERDEWLVSRSPNYYKIMVVEFNTGGSNYIPVRQASARQVTAAADDSSVSFDATQSLQQTLQQGPPVRLDKVAQASALVNNSNYPSDAALNQLAGFLASRRQGS